MKHKKKPFLPLLFLLIFAVVSTEQDRSAMLCAQTTLSTIARSTVEEAKFPTKEITEWVGDRFIFLGLAPTLRNHYFSIYPANQTFGALPYEKYVGKIVKITSVRAGSVAGSYTVEMQVEGTGERLRANASRGNVDQLGSMSDIERARSLYVGRTLWRADGTLQVFDDKSGKTSLISVSPFDPLKVVAVTPSWDESSPVRIFVRTASGAEAYWDVNFSATNIIDIMQKYNRFAHEFQLVAPPKESASEASRSYKPSTELVASASGNDVLGWQLGWWGMTADEILDTYASQLQELPERRLYAGKYAEYMIPNYKVDDARYTVIFQMDNRTSRLAQVLIRSDQYATDRPNLAPFNALEAWLLQKYGPMLYHKDENGSVERHERRWVFKTTSIELSYLFISGTSNQLTIRYYPTISSTDKP